MNLRLLSVMLLSMLCVSMPALSGVPAPEVKPALAVSLSTPVPPKKYRPAADGSLSQKDAALYEAIFKAQEAGRIATADKLMWQLSDMRLRGHVLYQRYMHPTAYTSRFDELKSWLDLYADHPGADKIYKLALRKGTDAQAKTLRKPQEPKRIATRTEPTMVKKKPFHKKNESAATSQFEAKVLGLIKKGNRNAAVDALFKVDEQGRVSKAAIDYYKAKIAESYLYRGDIKIAHELAHPAFSRSGDKVPLAGWVCGLVSWHSKDYAHASHYFSGAAESDYSSGWMQSAASYWAARSYARQNNGGQVRKWLARAQQHPRTFYGLLAAKAAGTTPQFNWEKLTLDKATQAKLSKDPAVFRAIALINANQKDLAEQEIMHINASDTAKRKALLQMASSYDLPSISIRLGSLLNKGDEGFYDAALYPDIEAGAQGLYKIDPALVQAIVRQESRFDSTAQSYSGARGLMQLMPKTAAWVAQTNGLPYNGQSTLSDPAVNLKLGQKYIAGLLQHPNVQDDMVSLLVAYNAGPGNLGKWKSLWNDVDDTLLFIELMPSSETREYVERVLSNYWIYRMKQDRELPTLEALAKGQSASYKLASRDLPFRLAQSN